MILDDVDIALAPGGGGLMVQGGTAAKARGACQILRRPATLAKSAATASDSGFQKPMPIIKTNCRPHQTPEHSRLLRTGLIRS